MNQKPENNVIRFPRESAADIEVAAAEWLLRLRAGAPGAGDIVDHAMWRAESADHDRIYRDMERVWAAAGARGGAVDRGGGLFARLLRHRSLLTLRHALIAASVVLTVGGAIATREYLAVWHYDYHTGPGEIRRIALADGSTVTMKGDTALDVRIADGGTRTVALAKGEAFFDVTHDAARPFLVDAGSAVVKDLGTGFSVERHGPSGVVSVDHGVVQVVAAGETDVLGKGQQVRFGLYDLGSRSRVDTGTIAAWRRGLYVAENKPLSDVLDDLGEYYPGRIVVTSGALSDRRINAVVQLDHIDAWLDTLGRTDGVAVRRWGPLVIVSTAAR